MIRILFFGALGKMGRDVTAMLANDSEMSIIAGVESTDYIPSAESMTPYPIIADTGKNYPDADVWIEFTHAKPAMKHIEAASDAGKAILVASTGFSQSEIEHIRNLSMHCPILFTPNLSLGVASTRKLVATAVKMLGDAYDTSVLDIHHSAKRDAPSGTAKLLAEPLSEDSPVLSIRGGGVFGEHTIRFLGEDEEIQIVHRAFSRRAFSRGVPTAVHFLMNASNGFYTVDDLYGK